MARHEGPETARGFVYSAREIAELLVELGKGQSLRKASARLRRETARGSADKFGNRRVSHHGQLVMNYLATFAPLVIDELLPRVWPPSVVLDGAPFLRRTTYDDGAPRQGGPLDFQLYAAYGYTAGKGTGFLWHMDMRGGADNVEWAAFLGSLPTDPEAPPDWVVADHSGAIKQAAAAVWPSATFYACEKHLGRLGDEALASDHVYPEHDLGKLWREAQWTRDNWQKFLDALDSSDSAHMKKWVKRKRKLIEHQFDIRRSDRIRATGAIETALDNAKKTIGERHFVFRNAARLRLLLGLVTLHEREDDDVRLYTNIIRKALLANRTSSTIPSAKAQSPPKRRSSRSASDRSARSVARRARSTKPEGH